MPKTILVVDDKANVRTLVRDYLAEQGYRVLVADNGQDALYEARRAKPDLILLDIMMPEMDGLEFIRAYRKESETPVILLTARLEESDKVIGLELGADDYITKPFGMRELVARITVLRRAGGHTERPTPVLRAADIVLDKEGHSVLVNGRPVRLTPSEFDILAVLMGSPGRVFSGSICFANWKAVPSRELPAQSTNTLGICASRLSQSLPIPAMSKQCLAWGIVLRGNSMPRSITTRLILAFLLVGVIVLALASGITYWLTAREFKQLAYDQSRDRFVADMAYYYETHGSWSGVLPYYQQRSSANSPFNPPPNAPGAVGGEPRPQTLFFALADQDGRVVVPAGGYRAGEIVSSSALSRGTTVTANGVAVGTALVVGNPPPLGGLEQRYLAQTNLALLYAALGGLALALAFGIVLARALTHPIRDLTMAI